MKKQCNTCVDWGNNKVTCIAPGCPNRKSKKKHFDIYIPTKGINCDGKWYELENGNLPLFVDMMRHTAYPPYVVVENPKNVERIDGIPIISRPPRVVNLTQKTL